MSRQDTRNGWGPVGGSLRVVTLAALLTALSALIAPGCLNNPLETLEPRPTATLIERLTQNSVDKIDLLLVIDNSGSMADKQEILNLAVPDLVDQLLNPLCVDDEGQPAAQQPTDPLQPCPSAGSKREFEPVLNVHIGIITSSLGGHGADACLTTDSASNDDRAHLLVRSSTDGSTPEVASWQDKGFLVWDPSPEEPTHTPQGETNKAALIGDLRSIVGGAGEVGCGYEATLESWYRFLIDPDPYDFISLENDAAVLHDTDQALLEQRRDFLRPDSLLAIIMLSDENDCSMRDGGQFYYAAQQLIPGTINHYRLPKPRAACLTDPNSPCCRSCGQAPGNGCDTSNDDCATPLLELDDHPNLRCFDQKRRFGIDFLYPIDRYASGLTAPQIQDRFGNPQPNPLFDDLNPADDNSTIRNSKLVFIAGIVGVPWQDIARRTDAGVPDLLTGLNADGEAVGGLQSGDELTANDSWKVILGDPSNYVPPTDPLMIESVEPRTGVNPVTGDPLQPPGSSELANSINGHEYANPLRRDLQFSCIFPLLSPRDCGPGSTEKSCDCTDPNNDLPLCVPNPADGGKQTLQKYAKAYPGRRELSVLRELGSQGIVGSICPGQTSNQTLFDFGYRPAVGAIVERLKQELKGQCLSRSFPPNSEGQVSCLILEASTATSCDCGGNGRSAIDPNHPAVLAAQADQLAEAAGWNCFCKIEQTLGPDLVACQNNPSDTPTNASGESVHGWCYVDATTVPPTGNPEIVASCPSTERRIIRFVGDGGARPGSTLFITCSGDTAS